MANYCTTTPRNCGVRENPSVDAAPSAITDSQLSTELYELHLDSIADDDPFSTSFRRVVSS